MNTKRKKKIIFGLSKISLGLFVPFAKSGKALVFASMITLGFGHWMSIGSIVHFTHQPIYSGNNIAYNCSGGTVVPHLPYPSNQQNNIDKRYVNCMSSQYWCRK